MKGFIAGVVFITLGFIQAFSQGVPDSLVMQGNTAYNEGRYQQAAEYYQAVIGKGYVSSDLYYNLGNSYFKLNDIPSAILYYEKALKLDPKDEDINFNLSLANSRIIDRIEPLPEFFLKTWWKQVADLMSPDRWAWAGILLFVAFLFLLAVFLVSGPIALRKTAFWSGLTTLLLSLLFFFMAYHSYREIRQEKHGIIFTPTVTVKSSPSENSVDLFVIHEGTKVRLVDKLEGWTQIRIANGSVGWVRNEDYRSI